MSPAPSAKTLRVGLLAVGGVGLVLASAGCGAVKRYENANVIAGKIAFVERCGSCHTLARAGTNGTIGPNLDAAFRESISEGLGRSAIESVVSGQIRLPNPNGAMPPNLASGQLAQDIAAYVALDAARPAGSQDTGLLAEAGVKAGAGPPAVEKDGILQINADPTGQLSYVTRKAVATAGQVTFKMADMSPLMHNIALQEGTAANGQLVGHGAIVATGGTSTFTANLKPGTYTYFCQVPGHRAAGMYGTLTVK